MKTYTFDETFEEDSPVLVEGAVEDMFKGSLCPISKDTIKSGDLLTRVLLPNCNHADAPGFGYDDVIVKTEALKAKGYRYFRGEVPRIALPEEVD